MKKLLLSLFIFSSLVIGGDYVSADELKCVYDDPIMGEEFQYIITYNGSNIELSYEGEYPYGEYIKCFNANGNTGKWNSATAMGGCELLISANNFETEDGLKCPSNFYFNYYGGGSPSLYYYGFSLNRIDEKFKESGIKSPEHSNKCYAFNLNKKESIEDVDKEIEKPIFSCDYRMESTNSANAIADQIKISKYSSGYKAGIVSTNDQTIVPTIDIASNAYKGNGCNEVPVLYTNCNDAHNYYQTSKCTITTKKTKGYVKLSLVNEDSGDDIQQGNNYDGSKFQYLLGTIKSPLNNLTTKDYSLLNGVSANNEVCDNDKCDRKEKATRVLENQVKETYSYCQYVNANFKSLPEERLEECDSFIRFYNELVTDGVLNDLTEGCDLISSGIRDVLEKLLFLIQIAGPIFAIILGSLDFIKVIFNGDPDKEFKEAFKRIKVRLIAAALLFLIPMLLSATMNLILPGQSGYDENNPFCKVD